MSRGCRTLMQPTTPCRRGWTAWQISCRVALQALPIIPARPIGYVPSHTRANEFLPRLPFLQSMRSRDRHRGLRNPLEAERFQVSVEGERRVDAFPLHQNLGRAIRVRNARRSMSPEGRVGLPFEASVRLPVENVLDKSKSGSQDRSPSRDAHSERACRAASFKVSPLASAVRKTNA